MIFLKDYYFFFFFFNQQCREIPPFPSHSSEFSENITISEISDCEEDGEAVHKDIHARSAEEMGFWGENFSAKRAKFQTTSLFSSIRHGTTNAKDAKDRKPGGQTLIED